MPIAFSTEDLGRTIAHRALTRGRSLVLAGAVEVEFAEQTISAAVQAPTGRHRVRIVLSKTGMRVALDHRCSCGETGCAHVAAAALAALDRFPSLRKPEQRSFIDTLVGEATAERQRTVFEIAPGMNGCACVISPLLVGERSGVIVPTTPGWIFADETTSPTAREIAKLLGNGDETRVPVASAQVDDLLPPLASSGLARWHAGGRRLVPGPARVYASAAPTTLPPRSGVIVGTTSPWYVDAGTGAVGTIRVRPPVVQPPVVQSRSAASANAGRARKPASAQQRASTVGGSEQIIVERSLTPLLRLTRFSGPDETGRTRDQDGLLLDFDYEGAVIPADDERQFIRVDGPSGPVFVRRDHTAEAAALSAMRQDNFVQMRMASGQGARGRLVYLFRGRDAAESWQRFMTERLPMLQGLGWREAVDPRFGPRVSQAVGNYEMRVADAPLGGFSLDFSIDVDGVRHPLLPILVRLRERGGMAAASVVAGELVTSLPDGRILRLPADRIARLLAVMDDLIEGARRSTGETLVLAAGDAAALLDLEGMVTARWHDGAAIAAHVARFRGVAAIAEAVVPANFTATLRPYQQQGVNWLQHLRAHGLGGFLADDMGLGKTAQTIAHLVIEEAAGRLAQPALIVVPTSLVTNWTAELARFAPHVTVVVLHGLDRHARRLQLDGIHVVITTYAVLARDIEDMAPRAWSMVVLDEAQAIKSSTAKTTIAVCRLDTPHRLCLSGTPVENNLGELWSQFAFVMPGLLGHRRSFTKRFRTPIEKGGNVERRDQLAARIRPFILRRTKAAVATELPPKNTILRRITLAPEQRELYETIRATLHERVTEEIAEHSLARSQVLVLDALLKLRQVCCDPRLVKLASARLTTVSSKLEDLLEMTSEMIGEGRRILLFSQFTSMLDLIKPRLEAAGIGFVELRGDTRDRATPVRRFEAGEVPLFLISLKAGGRGLNLVSADTVIHYDPWWNPAVEEQASDRAHRIGQTKSVFVYKLIAADTVEERILALQERKAALAGVAFGSEGAMSPAIAAEDIEFLFGPAGERLAA